MSADSRFLLQEKLRSKHQVKEHPDEDDEQLITESFLEDIGIPIPDVNEQAELISGSGSGSGPDTFQTWMKSVDASFKCLKERNDDNKTVGSPGGSWPYSLSMVATYSLDGSDDFTPRSNNEAEPSSSSASVSVPLSSKLPCCSSYNVNNNPVILLVAWKDPSTSALSGRVVDVKDERIMALVPARHSLMNFRSAEIILQSIHVRPHKSGPKDRPALPSLASRCQRMWESAVARLHATSSESVALEPCIWCDKHDSGDQETEALFICALCLLPCHLSCSKRATEIELSFDSFDMLLSSNISSLIPKRFSEVGPKGHNAMCRLCEHHFYKLRVVL